MAEPAVTDPVAPFDTTVDDVAALLPAVDLLATLAPGQRGVSQADARRFLEMVTGQAVLRLRDLDRFDGDRRDQLDRAARDAIANGAASYVQAARYPEQAAPGSETYAAVLWRRYETGLDALERLVERWIADLDADEDEALARAGGAAVSAPCSRVDGYEW